MNKKFLVTSCYLGLLALAACGPVVIDDADQVSVKYSISYNGEEVKTEEITRTIGEDSDFKWMDSYLIGGKVGELRDGTINGNEAFPGEYKNGSKQEYAGIIMTEVLGLSDPQVGDEVNTSSLGTGVIIEIGETEEGYSNYIVDFNDPMYYSDVNFNLEIINIEKN